jgi:hypothetical protein
MHRYDGTEVGEQKSKVMSMLLLPHKHYLRGQARSIERVRLGGFVLFSKSFSFENCFAIDFEMVHIGF